MTNLEDQRSGEREMDDVGAGDGSMDDVEGGLAEGERGERMMEFIQAMDVQVLGACRNDERLKPLLKLNVSCDAAEHRLLAHLTQHFEASEVGMLARCLCIPLVSMRVGKIKKQGTLLCPTATRGKLNLTLLPTSELRFSFIGDDGRTERLGTLISDSLCPDIAVEEIQSDTSGRSFLLKGPNGKVFYFWSSERSKLLGSELLLKMKDLLKKKPSLAELTGISKTRLECFATYLRTYLGSSLSTTLAASASNPSYISSDSSESICQAAQSSSLSQRPLCSRNISSQSFQVSLSPRASSFKEGSSGNLSSRSFGGDKLRRWNNQFYAGNSLLSPSPIRTDASSSSSSHPEDCKIKIDTKELLFTPKAPDLLEQSTSLPFLCPMSQVSSLPSSLLSPYYCWCPPVPSTLQYTVSSQFPLSSTDSLPLPPLSSLLPVNRSSNVLTPPLEIPDMPNLNFPPLFSEPLMRFPLPRSSSQQFATFTPLMCDPIVHVPVIDVCSSGPGYLVSAGSALTNTIPPLLPRRSNSLISESDSVAEEGARETLRLLINGSSQTNPSNFTFPEERHNILATGSRGLYTGVRDIGVLTNSFANLELISLEKLIGSDMANRGGIGSSSMDEVEKSGGIEDKEN